MIRVTCGSCGAAFGARDEHAGRRGRCPKCGAAVDVPGAAPAAPAAPGKPAAAAPPASPAPRAAAPAAPRAPRARRAEGEGGGGAPRRGGVPRWFLPAAVAVVLIGVVIVVMTRPESAARQAFDDGVHDITVGRYDEGLASLESIPATDELYVQAQEKIKEVRERQRAEAAKRQKLLADNLHQIVMTLRKEYVERAGPTSEWYVPYTRYMLKQAQRFLDTYPDDARVPEIRNLFTYYATVVPDPKAPPTEADVKAEVYMREQTDQYGKALEIIAEFGAQGPEAAKRADTFRMELGLAAEKAWAAEKSRLAQDGTLDSKGNSRSWKKLYEATTRFLDSVEGLTVAAEVRALRDKAAENLKLVTAGALAAEDMRAAAAAAAADAAAAAAAEQGAAPGAQPAPAAGGEPAAQPADAPKGG